jgi:hypothetical protein
VLIKYDSDYLEEDQRPHMANIFPLRTLHKKFHIYIIASRDGMGFFTVAERAFEGTPDDPEGKSQVIRQFQCLASPIYSISRNQYMAYCNIDIYRTDASMLGT